MVGSRVTPNIAEIGRAGIQISENMNQFDEPRFVFAACQHGAEPTIKQQWAGAGSSFRLAFSRPGLLTLKIAKEVESPNPQPTTVPDSAIATAIQPPKGLLIRQSGFALGQLRGEAPAQLVDQAFELPEMQDLDLWDAVHVFERDSEIPGSNGFEPQQTELCQSVTKLFGQRLPNADTNAHQCASGSRVLDVIIVEPGQWFLGHHIATEIQQCWPGGSFPVVAPAGMISRAYLKMSEALAWSELPFESGDRFVEIGSAPGGASQRLLDLGMHVTGIDPAEMDTALLNHERFEHWRSKSSAIKRKRYSKFRWLAADANVAPNYTLDAVADIVNYPTSRFQGLLLTLKLSSYDLVGQIDDYVARVKSWGYENVKARQLSFNRRECCLVAQR